MGYLRMPKVQCINRTTSFLSSHNTYPSKSVLRRNSCRSYQFILGQNKSEKGNVQLKNKTGFGDNRLIGTSREEESMVGWNDQFLKSDPRTTTSYWTYSKVQYTRYESGSDFWSVCCDISIWEGHILYFRSTYTVQLIIVRSPYHWQRTMHTNHRRVLLLQQLQKGRGHLGLITILNLVKLLSECTILITLFKASFNNPQSKMYIKYTVFN